MNLRNVTAFWSLYSHTVFQPAEAWHGDSTCPALQGQLLSPGCTHFSGVIRVQDGWRHWVKQGWLLCHWKKIPFMGDVKAKNAKITSVHHKFPSLGSKKSIHPSNHLATFSLYWPIQGSRPRMEVYHRNRGCISLSIFLSLVLLIWFLFTMHCDSVVLLSLSLAVLGHTGVRPSMRQSEGPEFQPLPSNGPLPLQAALCTANIFTYSGFHKTNAFWSRASVTTSLLPIGVPSLSQVMLGTGTPEASHRRATWEPRV